MRTQFYKFVGLVFMSMNLALHGQELGEIALGMGVITSQVKVDESEFLGLNQFIAKGLSQSGMAYCESTDANFLVQVNIEYVYEKDIDINGVPLKAAELQYNFNISSRNNELQFGQYSTTMLESGETNLTLLRNANRNLRTRQVEFQKFLYEAKKMIFEYYSSKCEEILFQGEQYIKQEQFDECIFRLGQVPKEVPCFKVANELIIKAYLAKLTKNCEIKVGEIKSLIHQESYSKAYDGIMILPQNSKCSEKVKLLLEDIDHAVCERYLLAAETQFSNGKFDKCVDILSSIEKISKNCMDRKILLEKKMRSRLDAAAKKQWEFKLQKYNDQITKDVEAARTNHAYAILKLDQDSKLRSKELDVSVEMERYKTQREIEFSKNNAAVDKVRFKELRKIYRAYYKVVGNVIINSQIQYR
ncbi:MAG: hypothetical protein IPL31_00055 [Saprospiraceae bacterium]|nr:hypothetical protein [Saprospiraceae bacterium]